MGKRRVPESGRRRRPSPSHRVFWAAAASVLTLAGTGALAVTGVGEDAVPVIAPVVAAPVPPRVIVTAPGTADDVIDPYAKDQITKSASESPSAETPVPESTPASVGASSTPTAPVTGTSVASKPTVVPPTVTVTETVTVAAAAAEEDVVAQATKRPPVEAGTKCVAPRGNYDGVKPYVALIGAHIQKRFGVTTVAGKANRPNASEHPLGLALDFMTNTGNVDGDAIRDYLVAHAKDFNIRYVIWQQQITLPGKTPRDMEDRGSDTANHRDHVHVSFNDAPGPVTPTC